MEIIHLSFVFLLNVILSGTVGCCSFGGNTKPEVEQGGVSLFASDSSLNKFKKFQEENKCGIPGKLSDNKKYYIYNGDYAEPGQFPWMALLDIQNTEGRIICSSQIITRKFVITAGHCFADVSRNSFVIVGNFDVYMDEPEDLKRYKLKLMFLHNNYEEKAYMRSIFSVHDIALGMIADTFDLSNPEIGTACLPIHELNTTNTGFVLGESKISIMGYGETEAEMRSCCLKYAEDISTISMEECQGWMKTLSGGIGDFIARTIDNSTLCAIGDVRKQATSCLGDSGGGYYFKTSDSRYVLMGTTAFGHVSRGRCEYRFPVVTSFIPAYIGWIINVVEKYEKLDSV